MNFHHITHGHLSLERVRTILERGLGIALSEEAAASVARCRAYLDEKMENHDRPVYGVTTGFGSLCNISIGRESLAELQRNLVRSHACGTGERVPREIVRLILLLKVQSLCYGHSGVQLCTVQRLCDMYNEEILPVIYQQGSLGASGDLAPLAHMSLPLIGEGEVEWNGTVMPAGEMLVRKGWKPLELASKEGLALLNGTQFMSAYGVWALLNARRLSDWADAVGALSLDAFDGRTEPFEEAVHAIRPHRGQLETARRMRQLLAGSRLAVRRKEHVQDPYSFRCIPQVHGAVKDAIAFVNRIMENEINSPTDNPTVFPDDDVIVSAGNFHGEPIAMPMDYLALALTELSNISERRIYKLIGGTRGLPSFLVARPGLNSGFMIAQYAAASVLNQNKSLCWPTSCDSIPSSQGQEDHVSMGANSATKLLRVVANATEVLGIELFTAAQALEFRRPLKSSACVESLFEAFRREVPFIDVDTVMSPLIHRAVNFVKTCEL